MKPIRQYPQIFRAALSLCLTAAAFLIAPAALAALGTGPKFVVNSLAGTNDNACDAAGEGTGNKDCTLQEAINAANNTHNAVITFSVSGTIALPGAVSIGRAMTIDGSGQTVTLEGGLFLLNSVLESRFNALTMAHGRSNLGGALILFSSNAEITNCTFRDNVSTQVGGGAIYMVSGSQARITNSTFHNNTAQNGGRGGAIYVDGGSARIRNCTFLENSGGLAADVYSSDNGSTDAWNSLFVNATNAFNCRGISFSSSHNIHTGGGVPGTMATAAQIKLDIPQNNGGPTNTAALLPGSVAINAGNNDISNADPVNNKDQRGYARVREDDPISDVGAYEYGATSQPLVVTTASDVVSALDSVNSLREAVIYAQSPVELVGVGGNGTGWSLNHNGVAPPAISGNVLQITSNAVGVANSAWYSQKVNVTGFTARFRYTQDKGSDGADGFTLTFQNSGLSALGGPGGGLGYAGIGSSAAIGFNIFGTQGVAAFTGGNVSGGYTPPGNGVSLTNGQPVDVVVAGSASGVSVTLTQAGNSATINFPGLNVASAVGGKYATVGFTGGTGGSTAAQSISNFSLTTAPVPRTVTFAPALAGQTITLSNSWSDADSYRSSSALVIDADVTIQGLADAPGITLKIAEAAQLRHFAIAGNGSLTLANLTLTGGKATLANFSNGGSIWNFGSLNVRSCTFTGNTASAEGGAIHSWGESPSLLIDNSTFSGNQSDGTAGAIVSGAVSMAFRHVTITSNTATNGHALVIYKYPLAIVNSLIAGNGSDSVLSSSGGTFSAASTNNILGSATAPGLTNGTNGNQLGVPVSDLRLSPIANNGGPTPTIALRPGSLAIDAGLIVAGLTSDQRGTERPQQSLPDIGAFELVQEQAAPPTILPPSGSIYERSGPVTIITNTPDTSVRYHLSGLGAEPPTPTTGTLYTGPFTVSTGVAVQAIAYGRGWIPSRPTVSTVQIMQPLAYWLVLHGISQEQLLENPSGDGIVNIVKYAFNLAPNAGDLARSNHQVLTPDGSAGLPSITRDGEGRLLFKFVRRRAADNPEVTCIPESSSDLLNWTPLDLANATVVPIDSKWERVTVVDPVVAARRFGRVRVTTLGVYYNDFDSGDDLYRVVLRGSATHVNGAVELTDGVTAGQLGAVNIEDNHLSLGEPFRDGIELTGFTARFQVKLGPGPSASGSSGSPGEGMSFAVGQLPRQPDIDTPPPAWGEAGPGTSHSLAVGFDTHEDGGTGSIGIHVWVNGVHITASPVNPYTNGALVPVEITWEGNSALTVKFNGATIFDRLPISGFRLQGDGYDAYDEDEFGFGARTSSAVQQAVVDQVQIEPRF